MRVLHEDMRVLNYCNRGARQFALRHNLDWSEFLVNGLDVKVLENIDDDMARAVVAQAKRRVGAIDGL